MPIWHQSPKLTPRYFLETPRLFGYPFISVKRFCVFHATCNPPDRMHLFELKKESYNVNIIVYYIYANTLFIYN